MPENTVKIVLEASDKTKEAFASLESSFKKSWLAISAAAAGFVLATKQAFDFARSVASAVNDIDRQSKVLGISTDELQKWQHAAKMSDVNAEELAVGIKLLSRNMEEAASGSGDAAKYFSAMGVSVKTTEGHLRPINDIMGDIMDKFASWEDGPRKIAIALQLFGRSGETLIPLLNQGRSGFERFAEEARKLGIILSPDLVRKGSEAEDILKRLEERAKATKLSFAPLVSETTKAVDSILKDFNRLDTWLKENKSTDWFPWLRDLNKWIKENSLDAWLAKVGIYTEKYKKSQEYIMAWEPGATPLPKAPPPGPPRDFEKYYKEQQVYYETLGKRGEELERGAYGGMEEKAFWDQLDRGREIEENLKKVELERAQQLADDMFPSMETVKKITEEMTAGSKALRQKLVEMQSLVTEFGWEDYASGAADASNETTRSVNQMVIASTASADRIRQAQASIQEFGSQISSVWSSHISSMIKGTETFAEGIKGIFTDMASYVIEQITKMAMNWALFGNTGGTSVTGGLLGLLGGALGLSEGGHLPGPFIPIRAFAGGGYADRPTLGLIGEGGEGEWIIPDSKMKGGGQTYVTIINNVNAVDTQSFGDAVKRNPGSIMQVISEDAETAGVMRDIVKKLR